MEETSVHEGDEPKAWLSELQQLERYPETNLLEKASFERLFRLFGLVTRKNVAREEFNSSKVERPPTVRHVRAKLFKLFKQTNDRHGRKKLLRKQTNETSFLKNFCIKDL